MQQHLNISGRYTKVMYMLELTFSDEIDDKKEGWLRIPGYWAAKQISQFKSV